MSTDTKTSSGVQQLIDRLKEEGVERGQSEAETIINAARQEAASILDKARREAEDIVENARKEADRTRHSGGEAVRLAGRDAILKLTEELRLDFESKLQRLVGHSLKDTKFLKKLIQEIARHAVSDESERKLNILLLADRTDTDKSHASDEESLNEFVRSLGGEALRDGLTFRVADSDTPGVRVQIVDDDLEIDLTTETLTQLLWKHLSPRFRKIIQDK